MDHKKAIDYILNRMKQELPTNLRYHTIDHTLSVLEALRKLACHLGVTGDERKLLLTAAAYHDSGFMVAYKNHEERSCAIAEESLRAFGFSKEQIQIIQGMIMATKIPQSPETHLEKMLADADLDYLGGDNYDKIAGALGDELALNGTELSDEEWLHLQIKFLEEHHYWTEYYRENRAPQKQKVLERLKNQALKP